MIDLKFENVSKRYRVPQELSDDPTRNPLMRQLRKLRRRANEFWAVNNVSFEVQRGESLGIIGHNGAGKSTILKMLSSITTPTSGEIMINGRLSALIEVGSGFHPELTGRENIYLSGSILGMRRREIAKKLESIVEFAGISRFIDTPVKRYSSGMYVRLGFAIAAHLDPDILLLDEVLAVGDAAFQAKCLARIKDLAHDGTTIVFISHDLISVERLCQRVLLMQGGEVVASGPPGAVISKYTDMTAIDSTSLESLRNDGTIMSKEASIVAVSFYDAHGKSDTFWTGGPLITKIRYNACERVQNVVFEIYIYSSDGVLQSQFTTQQADERINLNLGEGVIEFICPSIGLQPGVYYVDAAILPAHAPDGLVIDLQSRCATLKVNRGKIVRGMFYMPYKWRVGSFNSPAESSLEDTVDELSVFKS